MEFEKSRISRFESIENNIKKLESKIDKPKKKFKLRFKDRSILKKTDKKKGYVTILYLNQKYQMSFFPTRIVSGNQVVIDNKVHTLNPKKIWRYGKHTVYIIREIDRQPVSNDDYDEVKLRGDDTESDVVLIKAVLGAIHKPSPISGKNVAIILVIIAVAAGVMFFMSKGGV